VTDAEIDALWLEAFQVSGNDGKVRQRFAELCYQKGAAEMKERCAHACHWIEVGLRDKGRKLVASDCASAIRAMND